MDVACGVSTGGADVEQACWVSAVVGMELVGSVSAGKETEMWLAGCVSTGRGG